MYEQDLALNNQQWLICHRTQPSQNNFRFHSYFRYIENFNDDNFKKSRSPRRSPHNVTF